MVGKPHQRIDGERQLQRRGRKRFWRQPIGLERHHGRCPLRADDGQQLHQRQRSGFPGRRNPRRRRLQRHGGHGERWGNETPRTLAERQHLRKSVEHHPAGLSVGLRCPSGPKPGSHFPDHERGLARQQKRLRFAQPCHRRRRWRNRSVHDVGVPRRRQPQQLQQQLHHHAGTALGRLHSLRREHIGRWQRRLDGPCGLGLQDRSRQRGFRRC